MLTLLLAASLTFASQVAPDTGTPPLHAPQVASTRDDVTDTADARAARKAERKADKAARKEARRADKAARGASKTQSSGKARRDGDGARRPSKRRDRLGADDQGPRGRDVAPRTGRRADESSNRGRGAGRGRLERQDRGAEARGSRGRGQARGRSFGEREQRAPRGLRRDRLQRGLAPRGEGRLRSRLGSQRSVRRFV